MSEYENIFAKDCVPNWSEEIFVDKTEFRVEKVIKRTGNKLYVKWKGYGNSFYSWINKKYIFYIK